MRIPVAEEISLKNFLNVYFRENPFTEYRRENDIQYLYYSLPKLKSEIRIRLNYYSSIGRHQYEWPAEWMLEKPIILYPFSLVGLLLQDFTCRHPETLSGHRDFMLRLLNSCENLEIILNHLTREQVEDLFKPKVDFYMSESGLLMGHQFHPMPKSREGFNKAEFKLYSPELKNTFQLHYFLADSDIVYSESCLKDSTDKLIRKHLLENTPVDQNKLILPAHPWQARYFLQIPIIQKWIIQGKLTDLGCMGKQFAATSSVRTVYNQTCAYMVKCSLNVTITNSMRMQYGKELIRGIAAHRFWESKIGATIRQKYTAFIPLTDPAFMCLQDNEKVVPETAILLRTNYFTGENNVTSIATICQDHPYGKGNRFLVLLENMASKNNITLQESAILWFKCFLNNIIEPVLWIFTQYGVAIEAHQQNILLDIQDGLPKVGYYRDNQGYYAVDTAIPLLKKEMDATVPLAFCEGTLEFIRHHLIYYLICNNIFGVINAIGMTGYILEENLFKELKSYLSVLRLEWNEKYPILEELLESPTLPFKGNLLTRLYDLDELVAPLEQQSVYIEIDNLIRQ